MSLFGSSNDPEKTDMSVKQHQRQHEALNRIAEIETATYTPGVYRRYGHELAQVFRDDNRVRVQVDSSGVSLYFDDGLTPGQLQQLKDHDYCIGSEWNIIGYSEWGATSDGSIWLSVTKRD